MYSNGGVPCVAADLSSNVPMVADMKWARRLSVCSSDKIEGLECKGYVMQDL